MTDLTNTDNVDLLRLRVAIVEDATGCAACLYCQSTATAARTPDGDHVCRRCQEAN